MVVKRGNTPLLAFLVSGGASVEDSHYCHKLILSYAEAEGACKQMVDLLVKHGAMMKSAVRELS